jgi:prolyl-tRNA editing enzyme YbaK/EbsC (Cys-tRNA(Pro) deacylase)
MCHVHWNAGGRPGIPGRRDDDHHVPGGTASPPGRKKRLPVVIDDSVSGYEPVYCGGGQRGLEVEPAPPDRAALTGARIAPIAG